MVLSALPSKKETPSVLLATAIFLPAIMCAAGCYRRLCRGVFGSRQCNAVYPASAGAPVVDTKPIPAFWHQHRISQRYGSLRMELFSLSMSVGERRSERCERFVPVRWSDGCHPTDGGFHVNSAGRASTLDKARACLANLGTPHDVGARHTSPDLKAKDR